MKRADQLLRDAADAFADARDPFGGEWLAVHSVTLTECGELSDRIALVLRGYLAAPEHIKTAVHLAGAMALSGSDAAVTAHAVQTLEHRRLLRRAGDL